MDMVLVNIKLPVSHSLAHGLDASISCCFLWSYLKMESTLDTLLMLLESSNVFLAESESIFLSGFLD